MSTPQQHRLIGQVIAGRYRVVELLAEGGMGAVYIAEHLTLHKEVALKIVHPEHAGNAELTARFAREAMATSRIDHPNVISAIDFGTLPDDTAYLAVQLVRGPSLTKVLTDHGRMPWARAAEIGSQIADALSAAHGHGIVHRDLKPDNVLLQIRDDSELVKVLDFGVAKFGPESKVPLHARTDVTQIGMVVGTPGYMAPEQTIGNPADERSDLYALGVILWECLVGEPLWSAPDLQALVERQMTQTPPLVRAATGDNTIPGDLEALVAQLLAKRGEERPPGAGVVRDELHRIASLAGDRPRWRTGARPAPRPPSSTEVTIPLETARLSEGVAADPGATSPALVIEQSPLERTRFKPPSVPPPPPPSLSSGRPRRSSRAAWGVAGSLAAILGLAVFMVVSGRIELRPSREVAEVAQRVAKGLEMAPAATPEDAKSTPDDVDRALAAPTGLPAALDEALRGLLAAEGRTGRNEAADRVLSHAPESEVPAYLRHLALLQKAKSCEGKRAQVEALGLAGDDRALPFLKRLSERPKVGCGRKKQSDCLACLRKPLAVAISKLE